MKNWTRSLVHGLALLLASSSLFAQVWRPISGAGSPGYGNDVRGTSPSPEGAGAWWIATDGGGLYKTIDNGATWVPRNTGITHMRVASVWVDTGTLAGSTNSNYKVIASTTGAGVFLSTDSGANFSAINGSSANSLGCTYVRSVRVLAANSTPSAPARLLASTDCGKSSGVYYSDDLGANWKLSAGLPSDNLTVYNTSWIYPVNSAGSLVSGFTPYLLANTSQGIYKSLDSGLTWTALPSSPTGPNGPMVYTTTWSYVEGASPAMRLIAAVEGAGVFRSDDGGNTWVISNAGLPSGVISPSSGVSQDGSNTQTYYIALDGQGAYRSTDRGASWSLFASENQLPGVRQIAHRYSAASTTATDAQKKMLWASTYAGAYSSTDGGVTWNARGTGLPAGWTINSTFDNTTLKAYLGAADGVYQATGPILKGASWTKIPGLPRLSHVSLRGSGSSAELWAATLNFGVFKLVTDSTSTRWVPMNQGLPQAMVNKSPNLRIDPSSSVGWYLGLVGQGVYYFDGNSWSPRNNGLAGDALKVRSLTTNLGTVLASTDAGLYISTNNGQSWSQIGPKDASGNWIRPNRTAVDPSNPSTFWLTVYNTTATGGTVTGNGLWKSTDSGATWSEVSKFSGSRMMDVRYLRNSAVTVLTVSSWDDSTATGGVYGSQDNGLTWTKGGSGLTSTLVNALSLPYDDDGRPVATSRGGAFYWDTPLGLQESRQFLTARVNGVLRYFYYFDLTDYSGKVTGLTLSAGNATAQGTSYTQSDGSKFWQASMDLGTTAPAASVNYVATIARSDGNQTDTVAGSQVSWLTSGVSSITPNNNSKVPSTPFRIEWTPPAITSASPLFYSAQIVSATNQNTLWVGSNALAGQNYIDASPANLTPGTTYGLVVNAIQVDVFSNLNLISQASGSFCYACSGGGQTQTLTINAPVLGTPGSTIQVSATSSANLAVTLSSASSDICQVGTATGSSYSVSLSKAGNCQLVATQAGSSTVQPARSTTTIAVASAAPPATPNPGQVWQQVAGSATPGYGGLVRAMTVAVDKRLWIATDGGGLFVSEDGGANWSPRNNGIANTRLWSTAMTFPTASGTSGSPSYEIWAASMGNGVYYSADSGATFSSSRNTGLGCMFVRNLRFVGTRLFASTDCTANGGVYYSDNGGTSWTRANGLPSPVTVTTVSLISPSGVSSYLLAATSVGLFKSTDNGANFVALASTPGTPATASTVARQNVYSVVWGSANSTVTLLAAVEGLGIYRSTDDGNSWQPSNVGLPTTGALVPMSGVSTANGVFYIALDRFGTFKSTDQGLTWTLLASDSVLPSARGVSSVTSTTAGGTLYAGTQAGPYFSFDNGLSWVKGGAGLPGGMTSNVVFPSDGSTYAAAADGAYRLNSDGQTWTKIVGLPSMRQGHLVAAGADVYASTDSFGVYKLVNSNQWVPMNKGLPTDLLFNSPSVRQDTDNASALWAGLYGGGIYYYDPSAQSWQARNTGLSGDAMKVRSLALRGATILAATDGGVYISQDKGASWALSGPKLSAGFLRAERVAIDRRDPNSYYAAVSNSDALGASKDGNGLWVSRDRGSSWALVPALSGFKISDVRSFATNADYILTAASSDTDSTKSGLWISEDNGNTWWRTTSGIPSWYVNGVFFDARNDDGAQVYVATRGTGLFTFAGDAAQSGFTNFWRNFDSFTDLSSGSPTSYSVSFGLPDPQLLVSSITLSNGSTSTSSSQRYDGSFYTWMSLGTTAPNLNTTYTGVVSLKSGSPVAVNFKMGGLSWANRYPTSIGVLPCAAGAINCLPQIVWTPSAQAVYNTYYRVTVHIPNGAGRIWETELPPGTTSVAYTGPAFVAGTNYEIQVNAQQSSNSVSNQLSDLAGGPEYNAIASVRYTPGSDSRGTQSITFTKVGISAVGNSGTLAATASSGGAVNFTSDTPSVCWVNGSTLTLLSPGACVLNAFQAGTAGFKPAAASQTFTVTGGQIGGTQPQTITFTAITGLKAGGSATLSATATSGLAVGFSADPATTCTVSGNLLNAVSAGTCLVTAYQGGNGSFQPASTTQSVVITASTTGGTTTTVGSTTTTTAFSAKVKINPGWNLLGNGFSFGIDVTKIFGDRAQFNTVWKWVASAKAWAFYAPSLTAENLAKYAADRGYQVLSTIDPGEGFWVNAAASVSTEPLDLRVDQTVDASPFSASNFASGGSNQLPASWSLIAVGERISPRDFNTALDLFGAPPSVGGSTSTVAENLTTLWAWDVTVPGSPGWMFYAPSLDNRNTLDGYITDKAYRSFGSTKLGPGMGFWVNMPQPK